MKLGKGGCAISFFRCLPKWRYGLSEARDLGFLCCWNCTWVLPEARSSDVCRRTPRLGPAGGLCTPAGAILQGEAPRKTQPLLPQVKCYHKKYRSATRDVIFRLQFHTGAVQGYRLVFAKEDLDNASKGEVLPWVQTECGENEPSVGGSREPCVFLSLFSTTAPHPPTINQPIDKVITSLTRDWW